MNSYSFNLPQTPLRVFYYEFKRMIKIYFRNKSHILNSFIFFILSISVIHIGIGPGNIPESSTAGIIITYLIFTIILNSELMLGEDYRNGTLEEFLILSTPFEYILAAKYFAFSLILILVNIFAIPIATLLFEISLSSLPLFFLMSFLVTLNISLLALLCSAFTLGLNSSPLMPLLILPLSLPIIIIANLSVNNPSLLLIPFGSFLILFPITLVSVRLSIRSSL